jgi:hypothetical protein
VRTRPASIPCSGLSPVAEPTEPNTAQQAGAPDAADRHKILVESPEEQFFQD